MHVFCNFGLHCFCMADSFCILNLQKNREKFAKIFAKDLQNKQKRRQNSNKTIFVILANMLHFFCKFAIFGYNLRESWKNCKKITRKLANNLQKKLQNICKTSKNDGKTRKRHIFGCFANILQKNAISTCKMNPPYKKYANGRCKSIAKCNFNIYFQHPSLYQTNSHKWVDIESNRSTPRCRLCLNCLGACCGAIFLVADK